MSSARKMGFFRKHPGNYCMAVRLEQLPGMGPGPSCPANPLHVQEGQGITHVS